MRIVCQWLGEVASELHRQYPLREGALDQRIGALRDLGVSHHNMSPSQLREVMTTAHFNDYFTDALSRMFYRSYQYRTGSWQSYIYPDTVPDFRDVKRFRQIQSRNMNKRREKQGHRSTHMSQSVISYGVDEFSESFSLSWQVIVNDDLGAIRQVPQDMSRTVGEWQDEFVSALYDNPTTQAALIALGALFAGTGKLTHINLQTGINAMMRRTDSTGRQINVGGLWLVIPPTLQIQASVILESAQQSGSANNDENVIPRYIRGVRVDPYISVAGGEPWYLIADPSEIPTVTLARLRDWPGPVVFMKRSDIEVVSGSAPAPFLMGSFDSGDIVYAVEDVVGGWDDASFVGVTDYNGIYYSDGTTP